MNSVNMAPSAVEIPVPVAKSLATPAFSKNDTAGELKSPSSPLPEVKVFDATTCTVDELVGSLRVAGGLIVRGLLNAEELASLEKDTRPWLEQDTAWTDGKLTLLALAAGISFIPLLKRYPGLMSIVMFRTR